MPIQNTDPLYDNVTIRPVYPHVGPPDVIQPVILPAFISAVELATHIYSGVADAIADGDSTLMDAAIAAAIREASGYMTRFDYVSILGQTGTSRDPILMQYIKDIAVWHFITLANPNIDYEVRESRYKLAIRWFEKIVDSRFVPIGWPTATPSYLSTEWHVQSNPKRSNHY